MEVRNRFQEKALYDHRYDTPVLEDPEEFQLQYRQTQQHFKKLKIEKSPSFIGALRYTPDYHAPYQSGHSYPQRVALAIEAITPVSDLLPLKRPHYTGPQLLGLFGLPEGQANQDMARRLALSLSAGRQENQVD